MKPLNRLQIAYLQVELRMLRGALRRFGGHNSNAAAWLGISRRALYDRMRFHGIDGEAAALRTEAGIMGPRKVSLPAGKAQTDG